MDPALIYGPYGAIVLLVVGIVHLYRENTELRRESMILLKKYQDRDDQERQLRADEDRKRRETQQWRTSAEPRQPTEEPR